VATTIPKVGERFTVRRLTGYKLHQERPLDCRGWRPSKLNPGQYTGDCECGRCNGVTTEHPGTVEDVVYWMDNSIDIQVRGDDGELYLHEMVAPHGDLCF
jgi:hypothetical protein